MIENDNLNLHHLYLKSMLYFKTAFFYMNGRESALNAYEP
jgi:hypothetical protein